ncbi:MAG: hypothetical protein JNL70_07150 [Saprospiraceae bacterium]|nr:hypothetical protein [Saprospiraceae bacterium]
MTKLQDLGIEPLAKPEDVKGGFFFLPIIKIGIQIGYGYNNHSSYSGYQAPTNNSHGKGGKKGY